jgi:hypothetical protein
MVAGAACHRSIAVVLDLFIDPVAVAAGYWDLVGEGQGLLRYSPAQLRGLVCTMFLAPLGWILIARQREWGYWRKGIVALGALVPLSISAVVLSLMLNGALAALGLR